MTHTKKLHAKRNFSESKVLGLKNICSKLSAQNYYIIYLSRNNILSLIIHQLPKSLK